MAFENTDPGDIIEVEFETTNTGKLPGNQDILLTLENGDKLTVDEVEGLELDVDESGTGTLQWEIQTDQTGTVYDLCVESDDSSDCIWDPLGESDPTSATGTTELWSISRKAYSVGSSSSSVFSGDGNGNVYSHALEDGSENWNTEVSPDDYIMAVTYADGYLYCTDNGSAVTKLDASDGSQQWQVSLGSRKDDIAYGNGKVFTGDYDENIFALDADDGSTIWSDTIGSSSRTYGVGYGDGKPVFAVTDGNRVVAVDEDDGSSRLWETSVDANVESATVSDEAAYVTDNRGYVNKIDIGDGSEIYYIQIHDPSDIGEDQYIDVAGLDYNNGVVYTGGEDDFVKATDDSDESELWTHDYHSESTYGVLALTTIKNYVISAGYDDRIIAAELDES